MDDAQRKQRLKKIDPDDLGEIIGILNQAGEKLELGDALQVTTVMENWMLKLDFCMKHATAKTLLECYWDYDPTGDLRAWTERWPTQFLLAILDVKMSERFIQIFPQEGIAQHIPVVYRKESTGHMDLQIG